MAFNPQRSWSITYNQMWNLSMCDLLPSRNAQNKFLYGQNMSFSQSYQLNGMQASGSHNHQNAKRLSQGKRSVYCWTFNKGLKCKFAPKCKFIERCSYCDSPSHPIINCPKVDKRKKQQFLKRLKRWWNKIKVAGNVNFKWLI